MDYSFEEHLFRGQQGKSLRQVKPHLVAENASGSDSGPIHLIDTVFHNFFEEIQVHFHELQ
jgi:hypothetical protein